MSTEQLACNFNKYVDDDGIKVCKTLKKSCPNLDCRCCVIPVAMTIQNGMDQIANLVWDLFHERDEDE